MNNESIVFVKAREVLDSRGNPTVECDIRTQSGAFGRAIVPSGASTGLFEAHELRDGHSNRFGGKGVRQAVRHVNEILGPAVIGLKASDQAAIDSRLRELDGTTNLSKLGANAVLAVSLASAHAAAAAQGVPLWRHFANLSGTTPRLPMPMVNLISGGKHAGGQLAIQDFLFLPTTAKSYSEALEQTVAVYRQLGQILARRSYQSALVADEGGYGPKLPDDEAALRIITEAYQEAQLVGSGIAIDVASSHFFNLGHYRLTDSKDLSAAQMTEILARWCESYPVRSIEDGLSEDDWDGWRGLSAALGHKIQLIGDDLFVTNVKRLTRGITEKVANAVLVKVNQIGTLSDTLEVVRVAREAGYKAVISARSGESEDSTIADLAVGTGVGQIKIGSVTRSERLAKYNQLLRIEEMLGGPEVAPYAAGIV